jgi:hypothetical protein
MHWLTSYQLASQSRTGVEAETCVLRPNLPRAKSKNMRQLEKLDR